MMTRRQRIPIEKLRITVVYDNNPGAPGIAPDWGFACLIKGTPQPILFDTGGDGTILLGNLGRLGIAAAEIGVIFLSHFHGDHTGFKKTNTPRSAIRPRFRPSSALG
jgi:7,8-dihydropterin-6-yl-methyl-4-(beta-D-ribofuranosyl)aminobenzene 5'-phosphate synthase